MGSCPARPAHRVTDHQRLNAVARLSAAGRLRFRRPLRRNMRQQHTRAHWSVADGVVMLISRPSTSTYRRGARGEHQIVTVELWQMTGHHPAALGLEHHSGPGRSDSCAASALLASMSPSGRRCLPGISSWPVAWPGKHSVPTIRMRQALAQRHGPPLYRGPGAAVRSPSGPGHMGAVHARNILQTPHCGVGAALKGWGGLRRCFPEGTFTQASRAAAACTPRTTQKRLTHLSSTGLPRLPCKTPC